MDQRHLICHTILLPHITQGYRSETQSVLLPSTYRTVCMALFEWGCVIFSRLFMYSMSFWARTFVCMFPWEIHWWIYLLSPIILCFADGMWKPHPCLCASFFFFFLSPCIGRLGDRWSSFEPITQPDPLIITNLPESVIWGLPNSALCTMWLSCLSCCVFSCVCEGGESKEKEMGRERDCLHTFAHLSRGISSQSEIRQVCGRVSILGTQWTTHKGFISSYILPTPFRGTVRSFSPLLLPLSMSCQYHDLTCVRSHVVWKITPWEAWSVKGAQSVPHQQWLCTAVAQRRDYITLPHCCYGSISNTGSKTIRGKMHPCHPLRVYII